MPAEIHYTALIVSLLTGALATLIAMLMLLGAGASTPSDASAAAAVEEGIRIESPSP